jgi:hypothetical protein
MELLTLKRAAAHLGICEEVARRVLADIAVLVGKRKRYPLAAVERFAERGTV